MVESIANFLYYLYGVKAVFSLNTISCKHKWHFSWLDPQANVTKYDACSEVIIVNTNNSKEMRILLRKSLQLKAGIKLALRKGDTGLDFNLFDKVY